MFFHGLCFLIPLTKVEQNKQKTNKYSKYYIPIIFIFKITKYLKLLFTNQIFIYMYIFKIIKYTI